MSEVGNFLLASLTVIAQIISIILIVIYFRHHKKESVVKRFVHIFFKPKDPESKVLLFVQKHGMLLAFIVALTATLGSLFYSEILGYEPCKLCWYQRIFIYPQVILLGLALWKKDTHIIKYSLALAIIGGLIATNHYILQVTGVSILPCSAVGYSVSCSKIFVLRFGYITIPMMAVSASLLMTLALLFAKNNDTDGKKDSR